VRPTRIGEVFRYHGDRGWTLLSCEHSGNHSAIAVVTPNPIGDITSDGLVNGADLLAVIAAWGQYRWPPLACPCDLNHDSAGNVSDLLMVIGHWG